MSELTNILKQTAERLLADHVDKATLQAAEAGEWPQRLWDALEENGLTQPLVPESQGGFGATWADAFVIALGAGRHRAPVPLAETMAAGWLLGHAGIAAPAGPIALIDDGHDLARKAGGVTGSATAVPWGGIAPHALAVVRDGAEWRVLLLARDGATAAADKSLAGEPRDRLAYAGADAIAEGVLAPAEEDDVSPLRLVGALMRAAQIAGALGRAIELGVEHATTRQQFGRPIAKFQAIQQMLAQAAARTAEARMAAEAGFRAMDTLGGGVPATAEPAIAAAKVVCSEAVGVVTDCVHEIHGAIGFTEEHELHFTTRRLWAWRAEFGSDGAWAERLGRAVLKRGAKNLWPDLTTRI